ncbi:MAG: ABC transporter permease [Anaerolineae bacterium]|nr:ABC transporter permease [Anaerolineae bacterium]
MTFETVLASIFSAAFIATIIRASTPIILPAMGGLISELAGVINIALEGIMLTAAFFGVVVGALGPEWLPGLPVWVYPWLGALVGVLAGLILTLIIAFFHLELGADVILAALAINILASGGTVFIMFALTGDKGSTSTLASPAMPSIIIPFVGSIPVVGQIFNGENLTGYNIITYAAFLSVALVWLFLYRTRLGTHLRAVGENPVAAASVGIDVKRVQYIALLMSGFLAALGGINLSMGYLTLFQTNMTAGRGYIALAAVFLGNRNPLGTLIAALIFGAAGALEAQLGTLNIPSQLITMIPPIVTIAALVIYNVRRQAQMAANARKFQEKMESEHKVV